MVERRRDSFRMMRMPRRICTGSWVGSARMVSPQPLMAVRGVRNSWETEEMNSVFIFSFWPIFRDIWLMLSTSSPSSSLYLFSTWVP